MAKITTPIITPERRFKTFNQLCIFTIAEPYIEPVEMECVEYHTFEELLQKLEDMRYSNESNIKNDNDALHLHKNIK